MTSKILTPAQASVIEQQSGAIKTQIATCGRVIAQLNASLAAETKRKGELEQQLKLFSEGSIAESLATYKAAHES